MTARSRSTVAVLRALLIAREHATSANECFTAFYGKSAYKENCTVRGIVSADLFLDHEVYRSFSDEASLSYDEMRITLSYR